MEFTAPLVTGYTVYSKSGCPYCKKVKGLISDFGLEFTVIDCDEYLIESKETFLEFIKVQAGKEYKTFPMVFANGKFVGGYSDTLAVLSDQLNEDCQKH